MAQIREELVLVDKFSASFTSYLNYGNQAAGASEKAKMAAQNYQSVLAGMDQELIALNAQFAVYMQQQNAMAAAGKQNTAAFAELDDKMEQLGGTIRNLTAQYNLVEQEATEAAKAANQFASSNNTASASAGGLTSTLKGLVGSYMGIQGLKALGNLSDSVASTTSRLDMMNDGLQTTQELNDMIFASANRSRGAYQDTADMVAKLGTLAGDAFGSSQEIVAFAEQVNKQMVLSATTNTGAQAAMLQLTQAMSSGVLRGEELNTILEQTPTIAQAISEYLGVSTGEMRELASQGAITATVVKNALFDAADKTDEKFENMPMTWGQVWSMFKNYAMQAIQPVLNGVSWLANHVNDALEWVAENADGVAAILAGIGAAALVAGAQMVGSAVMSAAAWAAANWPILLVGAAVAALIYAALKAGATFEQIGGVIGGVFGTIYAFAMNNAIVPLQRGFAAIANFLGNVFNDPITAIKVLFYDMQISVLENLRNLAHSIEDLLNRIPGVSVNLTSGIDRLTYSVRTARQNAIDSGNYTEYVKAWDYVNYAESWDRGSKIGSQIGSAIENFSLTDTVSGFASSIYDGISGTMNGIAADVGSIKNSVSLSEEDLKSLVDMAERQYVNNINLTTRAPVINIHGQNTGNSLADTRALMDTMTRMLAEQTASSSSLTTAQAF